MKAVRRSSAFTLIELLSAVISILGILAAFVHSRPQNLGKSNANVGASRQLLDDVGRARQLAVSGHTTVYMVFMPTNFWAVSGSFPNSLVQQFNVQPTASGHESVGQAIERLQFPFLRQQRPAGATSMALFFSWQSAAVRFLPSSAKFITLATTPAGDFVASRKSGIVPAMECGLSAQRSKRGLFVHQPVRSFSR